MFIVIEHEVTDVKVFWETAQAGVGNLPSNLKLHQVFPSNDSAKAICLWEAATLEEVRDFVEGQLGQVSENTYFAVAEESALGLPVTAQA